jgi:hypothetical protein
MHAYMGQWHAGPETEHLSSASPRTRAPPHRRAPTAGPPMSIVTSGPGPSPTNVYVYLVVVPVTYGAICMTPLFFEKRNYPAST